MAIATSRLHAESLSSSSPCPGPFTAGHLGLSCSKQTGRQVLPTGNESGSRFGSQIKKDSEKQDQLHHWLSPLPFVTITAPPLLTFPIHLLMRSFPGVRVSAQQRPGRYLDTGHSEAPLETEAGGSLEAQKLRPAWVT